MSASKVDAIQAAVMKAAKAAMAEYSKRNPPRPDSVDADGKKVTVNLPSRGFVEKIIRSRLETSALVSAFVEDALESVGAPKE